MFQVPLSRAADHRSHSLLSSRGSYTCSSYTFSRKWVKEIWSSGLKSSFVWRLEESAIEMSVLLKMAHDEHGMNTKNRCKCLFGSDERVTRICSEEKPKLWLDKWIQHHENASIDEELEVHEFLSKKSFIWSKKLFFFRYSVIKYKGKICQFKTKRFRKL